MVSDYQSTFSIRRLWIILVIGLVVMFSTLLWFGGRIYQMAPPIAERFQIDDGDVLFTREDVERGQNVWQSLGGMQQGSI